MKWIVDRTPNEDELGTFSDVLATDGEDIFVASFYACAGRHLRDAGDPDTPHWHYHEAMGEPIGWVPLTRLYATLPASEALAGGDRT